MLIRFLFLGGVFVSSIAEAYPTIGDRVEWIGSVNRPDGSSIQLKLSKEVLGRHSASRKWSVKKITHFNGEKTEVIEEVADLYSPEQFKKMLASCESNGGTLEEITVPAGTYKTCKLVTVSESGQTDQRWWGDVPFGLVLKNTTESGNGDKKVEDFRSITMGF